LVVILRATCSVCVAESEPIKRFKSVDFYLVVSGYLLLVISGYLLFVVSGYLLFVVSSYLLFVVSGYLLSHSKNALHVSQLSPRRRL